jgi:uncharacterized membrane protein
MFNQILIQFIITFVMIVICVVIHGAGLFSLNNVMRSEAATERLRKINPLSPRGTLFTLAMVLAIISLHGIEIWCFALLYILIDAVPTLEEAVYFSTISYSTAGYNDAHIVPAWRLLGAFESILGVILMGWSTAFFFRMIGRIDPH